MYSFRWQNGVSIADWVEHMQFNPWLFAQVSRGFPAGYDNLLERPVFQTAWQGRDTLSRDSIAYAINRATEALKRVLGFYVTPQYIVSERHTYTTPAMIGTYKGMVNAKGQWKELQLNNAEIIGMGVESLTLLEAGATLTFQDTDGDGVEDQFTATVTGIPSAMTVDQAAVFLPAAVYGTQPQAYFEIKPVRASISGTTLTIVGHKAQVVNPNNFGGFYTTQEGLNVSDAIYVTTVDVYRRTLDSSNQATLIWENLPYQWAYTLDSSLDPCYPCEVAVTTGCFQMRDKVNGFVAPAPATYDDDTSRFLRTCPPDYREPDTILINYLSGIPRQSDGRVALPYRDWICLLATAYLPNTRAGGKDADRQLRYWQEIPLTEPGGTSEVDQDTLNNTSKLFGTYKRGAVMVYQSMQTELGYAAWRL